MSKIKQLDYREQQLKEIYQNGEYFGEVNYKEKKWKRFVYDNTLYYIIEKAEPAYQHLALRTETCINGVAVKTDTDLFNNNIGKEIYFQELLKQFTSNRAKSLLSYSYPLLSEIIGGNFIRALLILELHLEAQVIDEETVITVLLSSLGILEEVSQQILKDSVKIVQTSLQIDKEGEN